MIRYFLAHYLRHRRLRRMVAAGRIPLEAVHDEQLRVPQGWVLDHRSKHYVPAP